MIGLYTIYDKIYHDNIYQLWMVRKNMETIIIISAGIATAAALASFIGMSPQFL
jgi:hypothetical protein